MHDNVTIVALSSGELPSAIAIIRVSGPDTANLLSAVFKNPLMPRVASLRKIRDPDTGEMIDEGVVLWFPGPETFTGEDCAEFQVHGGRAVVSKLLDCLIRFRNVRLAEAGEFTRRAFENGKLDLVEIEGLADLISAQTEKQRKLAISQQQGKASAKYDDWRKRLIHIQAMYAAEIDFSDEGDIPEAVSLRAEIDIQSLREEMAKYLNDHNAGEIIREGLRVAIMGKPNAGKSSLLNALAKRDVAIVTEIAGTTRDTIDIQLDLGGFKVILSDTAGIRDTTDPIEKIGIERSLKVGREADIVVWLDSEGLPPETPEMINCPEILVMRSKDDDGRHRDIRSLSSKTGYGIDTLISTLSEKTSERLGNLSDAVITRARHRKLVGNAVRELIALTSVPSTAVDLRMEHLRLCGNEIGRLTGLIDVEDLLDVIFSEFCVGK